MNRSVRHRRVRASGTLTVVLCLSLLAAGCREGEREAAPVRRDTAPVGLKPQEILCLMPDSAMLAVCVAAPKTTWAEGLAMARKVARESGAVDAAVVAAVQEAAAFFNVPDAESFSDIARVRGIDPDAPVGLFLCVSHGNETATPPPPDPPEGQLQSPFAEHAVTGLNAVLRQLGASVPDSVSAAGVITARPSSLDLALVLRCTDPDVAEQTLAEMISATATDEPIEDIPEEVHGVCLHGHAPGLPCYFLAGTRLVVGNGPDLVRAIAARLGDPMAVRYGTPDCPAVADDDVVALVRPGEVRGWLHAIAGSGEGGMVAAWLDSLLKASLGRDPVVVTARMDERTLAVTTRVDYETHPDLRVYHGDAFPLRHPGLYSETAPLMTSVALTDARKRRFVEGWLSAIPRQVIATGPRTDQIAGMVRRIVGLLGDEGSLAVLGMNDGLPRMAGAVGVANTQEVYEFLLTLGLDLNPVASYGQTDILVLPLGSVAPVDVYYALVDDTLVAATDLAALHDLLERGGAGGTSAPTTFPSTASSAPSYQVLLARDAFLADVILPLLRLSGVVNGEGGDRLCSFAPLLHEARYTAETAHGWRVSELVLTSD